MTIELDGMASERVSLLAADSVVSSRAPALECRWPADRATPGEAPDRTSNPTCEELVVRWADSPEWPARIVISGAVRDDGSHRGRFIATFTIVAEY
jgi:hypothetical protein